MPNEDMLLQTFQIQVQHGLPGGFVQLSGSCANRIQLAWAKLFKLFKRHVQTESAELDNGGRWRLL